MTVLSRFAAFTRRYPVVRGMISYGLIWPTSSLVQQTIAGRGWKDYDWTQAMRFSLYGGLFVAPTLYTWVRVSSFVWPQATFRTAVTKAVVEQLTYGPAALVCFYFVMSLLDGKSVEQAKEEVKLKFLPSYKVAICVWPIVQTMNFYFVPERNRVVLVSVASLIWCTFLAYMHQLELKKKERERLSSLMILQQ